MHSRCLYASTGDQLRPRSVADGYEVSVPLAVAAGCLEGLQGMIRGVSDLEGAYTKPISIRVVSQETGYLAYTQGGPRVFISIDDFSLSGAGQLYDALRYLKQQCSGRLHWGKAGWQELGLELSGAADYGAAWCSFGCAVQQLDPGGMAG